MRITRDAAPDTRRTLAAPPLAAVRSSSSTVWMGMALAGVAVAVGSEWVALGVVVAGVGAYLLGKADRNIPADPRVAGLTLQNDRLRLALAAASADRPSAGEAPAEPRPLAVVPDASRRGGVDAAAAVDALDAPLPGEAGATEE